MPESKVLSEVDGRGKRDEPSVAGGCTMTSVPADEMVDLRSALLAGDWARLDDPCLTLSILDAPSAWPSIVRACAEQLTLEVLRSHKDCHVPVELFGWFWGEGWPAPPEGHSQAARMRRRPEERVMRRAVEILLNRFPADRRAAASLRLARHLHARWPRPERERALLVLARWPTAGE